MAPVALPLYYTQAKGDKLSVDQTDPDTTGRLGFQGMYTRTETILTSHHTSLSVYLLIRLIPDWADEGPVPLYRKSGMKKTSVWLLAHEI